MSTTMQTAIGRFVWHEHDSNDVEKARRFYTELLGWETEVWKPGEVDYPMISAKGQQHGGFGQAQGGAPPHWMGHVAVEDVDATIEKAKKAGGNILAGPIDMPEVGRFAAIADPQGAALSAYQAAGDAPVSEGVFAWDELYTSDVEGAKRFYKALFNWDAETTEMGAGDYTVFSAGETQVAGCMARREENVPPHWYPYLATPDVDASTAKAKELGATVYLEPTKLEGVGKFSVLGDPTGATFGLFEIPAS